MLVPGYWMNETSGVLRPVVEAYIHGEHLTREQVPIMRAYLRQWIDAGHWRGPGVDGLRDALGSMHSHEQVEAWLRKAEDEGVDPL